METSCKILTEKNFKNEVLDSHQPVVVVFAADWCGICHIIDQILNRMAKKFNGLIKVCKIDCDLNPEFKDIYGIHDLPTLLFFNQGQVVDHMIGAVSECEISEKIAKLLRQLCGRLLKLNAG